MNRYEMHTIEIQTNYVIYEVLARDMESALKKVQKQAKKGKPIEKKALSYDVDISKMKAYLVETKVKMPSKKKKKASGYDGDDSSYSYSHVACSSYPNCDIDPNGCRISMGDDVEEYGMRD